MSAQIAHNTTVRIPHSLKVAFIIGGACALIVVLAAVIAYLPEHPDFSRVISYLSDIRLTPGWPQIGSFPTPVP